jgi:hypothetical protein
MISDETYPELYCGGAKKWWARWVTLSGLSGFCLFEPVAYKYSDFESLPLRARFSRESSFPRENEVNRNPP